MSGRPGRHGLLDRVKGKTNKTLLRFRTTSSQTSSRENSHDLSRKTSNKRTNAEATEVETADIEATLSDLQLAGPSGTQGLGGPPSQANTSELEELNTESPLSIVGHPDNTSLMPVISATSSTLPTAVISSTPVIAEGTPLLVPIGSQMVEDRQGAPIMTIGTKIAASDVSLLNHSVSSELLTNAQSADDNKQCPQPAITTPRSLWDQAFDRLDAKDQEICKMLQDMSEIQQPLPVRMDHLIETTEKLQEKCEEKTFKFEVGGKTIVMRDVASNIITWLNKFKEIGDIIVQYDPGHAALPWAGFRFLLQAATAEQQQRGDLILVMEKTSRVISRGAIYELLYPPRPIDTLVGNTVDKLYNCIISLYAKMLHMIALCRRLFNKSTARRAAHSVLNPDELSTLLKACEQLETDVDREASNCHSSYSQASDRVTKQLLQLLKLTVDGTQTQMADMLVRLDHAECEMILTWISDIPYGANHQTVTESRTADTCEWLLHHNDYLKWKREGTSNVLWLCGTAGTGKTFLTSKVIDQIHPEVRPRPREGFAFFYCNRTEEKRQQPLSVLRAFIRQLSITASDPDLIRKQLKTYHDETRQAASEPTMETCKSLLIQIIRSTTQTTLVLDALDECENSDRIILVEALDFLVENTQSTVLKIFISGRPDGNIVWKLKDRDNIRINASDNQDDISKFVKSEILKYRHPERFSPDLRERVVSTLQNESQGMFQWAYLQIKQLLELNRAKEIEARLGKLPLGLKSAYDEIIARMPENHQEIAYRAVQWVMCACHPLTTELLLPAVCQDETFESLEPLDGLDEDLLLEYCHNLLVIDPVRKIWVTSHLSVNEYFENHVRSVAEANSLVASVCLLVMQDTLKFSRKLDWGTKEQLERYGHSHEVAYFSESSSDESSSNGSHQYLDNDAQIVELKSRDPLRGEGFEYLSIYARHHWATHVQRGFAASSKHLSTKYEKLLGRAEDSGPAYRCWHDMMTVDAEFRYEVWPDTSLLGPKHRAKDTLKSVLPTSVASFAVCALGLPTLSPYWRKYDWVRNDLRSKEGSSLLELASKASEFQICRNLINNGADVNLQTESKFGSALIVASYIADLMIVKLLLQAGAEVNMQLGHGDYGSALAAAATAGYGREEIVKLLIQAGAEVNMELRYGYHGSALAAAAKSYNGEQTVKLLIQAGAKVNMELRYGYYGSALAAAATSYKGEQTVKLLIQAGAEVNMELRYGDYGSALAAAAAEGYGREEIVKLLIQAGVEVNIQLIHGDYGSALAAAAKSYNGEQTVKLLIQAGAEVNMELRYGYHGSALAAAAISYKGEETVKLLIQAGAEVNMQLHYGHYGSALASLAAFGSVESGVAGLFIAMGADINMQLTYGRCPTALAAARSRKDERRIREEIRRQEERRKYEEGGWTQERIQKDEDEKEDEFQNDEAIRHMEHSDEEMVQLLIRHGAVD